MIIITVISIAAAAFLGGYVLGISNFFRGNAAVIKTSARKGAYDELLAEEYRNFLNYDGSEQI